MKLRHFLGIHAEDAFGKGMWSAVDLTKLIVREAPEDPGFQSKGRGPGSGPDATSYNVAKLLLAALADVPHPEANRAAQWLFATPVEGSEDRAGLVEDDNIEAEAARAVESMRLAPVCGLTGQNQLGPALQAILSTPALAEKVARVEVRRGMNDATIYWLDGAKPGHTRFIRHDDRRQVVAKDLRGAFRSVCSVGGAVLHAMARDLMEG